MEKRQCLHLEIYPIAINGIWYNRYKCKFSRIKGGTGSKKRLCNECTKQTKLEFK